MMSTENLDDNAPDLRAIGIGLNGVEGELAQCTPVVLHRRTWEALYDLGIRDRGINGSGHPLGALCVDEVQFLDGGRFDFARNFRYGGHAPAVIVPLFDDFGDVVDLAAWSHRLDKFALLRRSVPALGLENLNAPRLDGPVIVHETPMAWLLAGRRGLVILDHDRAACWLDGVTLGVEDAAFGLKLKAKMTISPTILVAQKRLAA